MRYIPAGYTEVWRQVRPRIPVENLRRLFEQCLIVVRELNKAGVTILAGADVGVAFQVPGFSLHDELSLLVKAGLSERQALEAATRIPARVFGITDQGTIETGMRADLRSLTRTRWRTSTIPGKYRWWLRADGCSTGRNWIVCCQAFKVPRVNGLEIQLADWISTQPGSRPVP